MTFRYPCGHPEQGDAVECEICALKSSLTSALAENAGIRAFEELGPGVEYVIADPSGYENTHWLRHDKMFGGDGLIYAATTLLEACRMFETKEGGVDHP